MQKPALALCPQLFRYVGVNRSMTQLLMTLRDSQKDLVGALVIFFVVFLAFVQLGVLVFGYSAKSFSTFGDAV